MDEKPNTKTEENITPSGVNQQPPQVTPNLIYPTPSTPEFGVSFNSQQMATKGEQKFPVKNIIIISSVIAVLLLVIVVAVLVSVGKSNPAATPKGDHSKINYNTDGPTALEKKLTDEQKASIGKIKDPLYAPKNQTISLATLSYAEISNKLYLSYSVNPQFGKGLIKGSYGYWIYQKPAGYNPLDNCQLAGGAKVKCTLFSGSQKDKPAYVYNGPTGGITYVSPSGVKAQPITLFGQVGNMIVTIETSDTNPQELYDLFIGMQEIKPTQLPDTTNLEFSESPSAIKRQEEINKMIQGAARSN